MLTCNGQGPIDTILIGLDKNLSSLALIPKTDAKHIASYVEKKPDIMKYGAIETFHCASGGKVMTYFLVGMCAKPADWTEQDDFYLAQHMMAAAMDDSVRDLSVYADTLQMELVTLIDGLMYRNYEFSMYRKDYQSHVVKVINLVSDKLDDKEFNRLCYVCSSIYEGIYIARNLVNMPPNDLTPRRLSEIADSECKAENIKTEILKRWNLEKLKMGGLLAVGKGSMNNPVMMTIEYTGNPDSHEKLAIVGKGITFDSGGLSLKSHENLEFMKSDMAGAATAIGVIRALMLLKYPVNVMAVIPCAENIPSGLSYHVDDIITSYSGKTIEIKNTDAEGRLILADGITYAQELGATKLIDLATLTGACVTAFGTVRTGVLGNNQPWLNKIFDIGMNVHEKMWPFPNDKEYEELIKSDVADIKNTGGREGGAITAGLFIKAFVKPHIPWIHLDIAGTAFCEKKTDTGFFGATGVGVKTILELLKGGQP
jgi:leucyl aminopeptidase